MLSEREKHPEYQSLDRTLPPTKDTNDRDVASPLSQEHSPNVYSSKISSETYSSSLSVSFDGNFRTYLLKIRFARLDTGLFKTERRKGRSNS